MFGSLGFQELFLIFLIALIIFGPRKLPEIGRSIGKAMGEFKKATNDLKHSIEEEVRIEEQSAVAQRPSPADSPTVQPPAQPIVSRDTDVIG
jgi:TatA/E family protein of Tat protein translocase